MVFLTQAAYLSYIIHSKPYKVQAQNYSDLFNEFTVMGSYYFLFLFTDFISDDWHAEIAGWGLIGLLGFNVFVNGIQIVYYSLKQLVFKIRLFYLRWLFKKLTKKTDARRIEIE